MLVAIQGAPTPVAEYRGYELRIWPGPVASVGLTLHSTPCPVSLRVQSTYPSVSLNRS
jgi:hypothetical protein